MSALPNRLALLEDEPEAPFEMTNLRPKTTGLPMTVWISSRGRAQHDVRVKVSMSHGNTLDPDNLAVMSVRPQPALRHGDLNSDDVDKVARWIALNEAVLVDIWNGDADPVSDAHRFRKLQD